MRTAEPPGSSSLKRPRREYQSSCQASPHASQPARPITALTYLLELQRGWARLVTYALATGVAKKYGGAFGIGIEFVQTMFDKHELKSDIDTQCCGPARDFVDRP
jgi:hypothetical protein